MSTLRKARRHPRNPAGRWLPAALAFLVGTVALVMASCNVTPNFKPTSTGESTNGTGGGSGCIGSTCPAACAEHEVPGCACSVEGQHLLCGKAEASFPTEGTSQGTIVCGEGFSVCTNGVWGDCQVTGATLVPGAPDGYFAQGLGLGTVCTSNPCDPQCVDFKDTPTGVDAGPNITASDAGLVLSGDAGVCVPKSCATLGFNCGTQSDGCGNTINCGTCNFPQTCGGAGTPSVCGVGGNCTGLCLNQVKCAGSGTTSISGVAYMPNGTTPLPNVLVYVPNAPLSAFSPTTSCVTAGNCTAEVSGSPLVATTSNIDGTFTLTNVPAGVSFPVVMQLGRFRRQFMMPAVTQCTNAVVACASPAACLSRFPQYENETSPYDNIPKMAFVTGEVDALECVWRKVGIGSTGAPGLGGPNYGTGEFTPGLTNGRINFYLGAGAYGTYNGVGTNVWDYTLLGSTSQMNNYDIILFPCQGGEYYYNVAPGQAQFEQNIASFVNGGGRVFATHFSYIWLYSGGGYSSPLSSAINWAINGSYSGWQDPTMGYINTSFPGGATLASWLRVPAVNASPAYGQMQINTLRHDFTGVPSTSQVYVSIDRCESTSSDPANCGSCGNVCGGGTPYCSNGACANKCANGLSNCGGGVCANESTDPNNCGYCGNQCGPGQTCVSGNCTCQSGTTSCSGTCTALSSDPNNCGSCGNVCGAGTTCVAGTCTCQESGYSTCNNACTVGTATDATNCGTCGHTCTGSKKYCSAGVCTTTAPSCGALTLCSNTCVNVSTDPNNCGGCGSKCTEGQTCVAGACTGSATCSNTTTDPNNCGGCGIQCGKGQTCVSGTCTCGSGSTTCNYPMQASFNTPISAPSASQCGRVVFSDFHVESATDTQTAFPGECNSGAFSPQEFMLAQALFDLAGCVNIAAPPACIPVTCGYLGLNCGTAGDGCGSTLNCGTCASPATCGGAGTPGVCGKPTTFSPAAFTRDYNATGLCSSGQVPVWRLYSYASIEPKDSHINFQIATATTAAGLATATLYNLGWSNPPGIPAGLTSGGPVIAHALNQPAGTPDTEIGSASPDTTLLANAQPQNNLFLRVVATLNPSSDLVSTPTLSSWDMQIDCIDNN